MSETDVPNLTVSGVGQILGLTPEAVRVLERKGKLPAVRTTGGIRLFRASDVERLRAERQDKRDRRKSSVRQQTRRQRKL